MTLAACAGGSSSGGTSSQTAYAQSPDDRSGTTFPPMEPKRTAGESPATTAPAEKNAGAEAAKQPSDPEESRLRGITAAHNRARASIATEPPLPPLEWSPSLASKAQRWAERITTGGCRLEHSSDAYGENIAFYGGQQANPEKVVETWMSERHCYRYGPFMRGDRCAAACNASGGCGHFTQVVWRESRRLGCGVASCGDNAEIWVCKYDPAGNQIGSSPY